MAKNSFVSSFYDETVTLKPTETYSVIKPRQVEPWTRNISWIKPCECNQMENYLSQYLKRLDSHNLLTVKNQNSNSKIQQRSYSLENSAKDMFVVVVLSLSPYSLVLVEELCYLHVVRQ